ncbi:unnamed protein product [Knipowitschia caucasica]|uniref:Steroid 21-hydroxylase n=1 Tax=Knipowitschia caucasica TaxID=637954 RepID=A0AAV2KN35_KNICA
MFPQMLCSSSALLLCASFAALVLWAALFRKTSRAGGVPSLPRVPLLGSLPWVAASGLPPHLLFTRISKRLGPLFALHLGSQYTLVVNSYDLAREVLQTRGKDFAGRPFMVTTDLLTRGGKDIAFCDYSPLWKSHRRLVHSAFTLFGEGSGRLQDIVLSSVDDLLQELCGAGRALDPFSAITRAVTNVVCTLVFSATYRPHDPELQQVIQYTNGIVQTLATGALVDIYPWLKYFPNSTLRKLKQCIRVRDKLLQRKFDQHKVSVSDSDSGDPCDLLDALLRGQSDAKSEVISDDHVLMTAAEAFGAGVETTSTAILWIIAYLLHHPEIQTRAQKELEEQLGQRPVRMSDRTRLPFVEAVIQEGLRIRPVSPILLPHSAMQPTSLGGHPVKTGTRVLVNMWAIHHNPQIWKQPDLFRPERFLDEHGERFSPPGFMPFGAGPRVCVGESLARLELFLFVSSLLQRVSFSVPPAEPVPDLRGRLGVVLQPLPYRLQVTPRPGWGAVEKQD